MFESIIINVVVILSLLFLLDILNLTREHKKEKGTTLPHTRDALTISPTPPGIDSRAFDTVASAVTSNRSNDVSWVVWAAFAAATPDSISI